MHNNLHREDFLTLEVGGSGLGLVNLCHWTGQHVLIHQEEVGIFAYADAASLILDEHLLGNVDGHSGDGLLAGDEFFSPVGPLQDSPSG